MTEGNHPAVHIAPTAGAKRVPLGDVGSQQVLLGAPRGDGSPLLMGTSSISAGQRSPLIEHDTAEVAYVIAGSGWMVTDTAEHAFAAGDAIMIDARCWHAIRAGEDPVEMLYVFPAPAVPPTRTHQPESS